MNPFEDTICETGGPSEIVYHITEDAFDGEHWMRDRYALCLNLLCRVQQLAQLHIVAWIRGCQVRQQLRKQHLAATRIQLCWLERSMSVFFGGQCGKLGYIFTCQGLVNSHEEM